MQFTECTLQKRKYFLISNVWYETILIFAIWILKNKKNFGYQKFEEKYDIKKLNQIRYHQIETNVISNILHIFDIIAFELRWYHNLRCYHHIKNFRYSWYQAFDIQTFSGMYTNEMTIYSVMRAGKFWNIKIHVLLKNMFWNVESIKKV